MTMTETLYQLLKKFNRFLIYVNTDSISFIIGTENLRFRNDEIIGDNITIQSIQSFTVHENTDSLSITFPDSPSVSICCI